MDCTVIQQLLTALNDAVHALNRAVERLADLAGVKAPDEFIDAHKTVMELQPQVDTARANYENYRREHGC